MFRPRTEDAPTLPETDAARFIPGQRVTYKGVGAQVSKDGYVTSSLGTEIHLVEIILDRPIKSAIPMRGLRLTVFAGELKR